MVSQFTCTVRCSILQPAQRSNPYPIPIPSIPTSLSTVDNTISLKLQSHILQAEAYIIAVTDVKDVNKINFRTTQKLYIFVDKLSKKMFSWRERTNFCFCYKSKAFVSTACALVLLVV